MDAFLVAELVSIHAAVIVLCIVLLRFMIEPYRLTRESRYLGLPLGFAFLAISHFLSALTFYTPAGYQTMVIYLQLFARSFAFAFLALTYYFSGKPSKNSRILWNVTFSLLIVALAGSFVLVIGSPEFDVSTYRAGELCTRIFNVLCLAYITVHTARIYFKDPKNTAKWLPVGYSLFAVSQALVLIWVFSLNSNIFISAMVLLLLGVAILVAGSYLAFYKTDIEESKVG
jgi:hypothetical protein